MFVIGERVREIGTTTVEGVICGYLPNGNYLIRYTKGDLALQTQKEFGRPLRISPFLLEKLPVDSAY